MMLGIGNSLAHKFLPALARHFSLRARELKSSPAKRSFTLVEVMVTVCILALGAVLIYQSFFYMFDLYNYYNDYTKVASWMDEKIWVAQNSLVSFGEFTAAISQGTQTFNNTDFNWDLSYSSIKSSEDFDLFEINLGLFWKQGKKHNTLSRTAYALYYKEEE